MSEPRGVFEPRVGRDAPPDASERDVLPVHVAGRAAGGGGEPRARHDAPRTRRARDGHRRRPRQHGERRSVRRVERPQRGHQGCVFRTHAEQSLWTHRRRLRKKLGRRSAVALRRRREGALRARAQPQARRGGGAVPAFAADHGGGERVVRQQRQRTAAVDQRGATRRFQRLCGCRKLSNETRPGLLRHLDSAPVDSRRGERRHERVHGLELRCAVRCVRP